ncbi:hypothetical protein V1477_001305 [Vespula maculifrons]|uniref:Uncharacterized protein n=1 Tax=Vespula maculifrons TaxID=7453 RepID=A0ABD2CZG6_VESMC
MTYHLNGANSFNLQSYFILKQQNGQAFLIVNTIAVMPTIVRSILRKLRPNNQREARSIIIVQQNKTEIEQMRGDKKRSR